MMTPSRKGDFAAVPFTTALERIDATLEPIGSERIGIEEALGRISARDLVAPFQIPSQPLALRDGFAVRAGGRPASETRGLRQLKVIGSSFPDTPASSLPAISAGEAFAVSTGAPLPPGADAVIPADRATQKEDRLLVDIPARAGSGVLFPGDDLHDGTPIVSAGRPLTPPQLGLLLATGLSHVEVFRTPRVGLISTGNEIATGVERRPRKATDPSEQSSAQRPPSNAIMLSAWCSRFGFPCERWVVADEERALVATLDEALGRCDALVTIGGTGGGSQDLVLETLEGMGGEIMLEGIRLRPGRTSGFGTILGKPVFLLPGSPPANETAFLLLALPGLLRLMGAVDPPFPLVPARFSRELRRSREQKRWTQAVRVQLSPGTFFLVASPLIGRTVQERQGRLAAVASANGLLLMEEGEDGPRTGDIVGVILLSPFWGSP